MGTRFRFYIYFAMVTLVIAVAVYAIGSIIHAFPGAWKVAVLCVALIFFSIAAFSVGNQLYLWSLPYWPCAMCFYGITAAVYSLTMNSLGLFSIAVVLGLIAGSWGIKDGARA